MTVEEEVELEEYCICVLRAGLRSRAPAGSVDVYDVSETGLLRLEGVGSEFLSLYTKFIGSLAKRYRVRGLR